MKFVVSRVSDDYYHNIPDNAEPPIPGCVLEKRMKKYQVNIRDIQTGNVIETQKEKPDDHWTIDINSLEQLMGLIRAQEGTKYGFIVYAEDNAGDLPNITIFDDYIG